MKDMMSSNSLTANSKATYIRYIRAEKVMVKHQGGLSLFEKMSNAAPVV